MREQNTDVAVDPAWEVLDLLGVQARTVTTLKDEPLGNACWLVEVGEGEHVVLRRYHEGATPEDLMYEHAVLRHLDHSGWVVPMPVGELLRHAELLFCLTRYVPGAAVGRESAPQRRRRGRDLACLDIALRSLNERIGQRRGWRAQHADISVDVEIDWNACLESFTASHPRLGAWAAKAAAQTRAALASLGADALPLTVVHGDFAEWNVHYHPDGSLAGVIDFAFTHLDSRPYELAIARTHRAPEAVDAYSAELARHGWPLTELELAAIEPVHRAFRVGMVAWELHHGRRGGAYDTAMIERQLASEDRRGIAVAIGHPNQVRVGALPPGIGGPS